jgi:hypothetical protein
LKRLLTYLLFTMPLGYVLGQAQAPAPVAVVSFQDSVFHAFEITRNADVIATGSSFVQVWASLGLQEQQTIQSSIRLMKKKGYKVRPHVYAYCAAIVNAQQIEKADKDVFNSFLLTAQKVIEQQSVAQAQKFLTGSASFFQYHALHVDKGFKLYVSTEPYHFDFLAPVAAYVPEEVVEAPADTLVDEWTEETTTAEEVPQEGAGTWAEEEVQPENNTPSWMAMVQNTPAPYVEGAVLVFEKTTLNFVTRYDSVFFKNTKGTYSFNLDLFTGEGGSFDFSPALLPPDSVYCTLSSYFFKANKAEIKSEMAKLTYKGILDAPVPGRFEFKSMPRKDSVASSYPTFRSYESTIPLKNVTPANTTLTGGFALLGNKITSATIFGSGSTLEIKKLGRPTIKAISPSFSLADSLLTSENTRITIYQENDSITHPLVRLVYSFPTDSTQRLTLLNSKSYMRYAPYASSFFNVDFSVNRIDWKILSDSLDLSILGGRSTVPMIIESVNYYDPEDYRALRGEGFSFHPLAVVANFCKKTNTRDFFVSDLATFAKLDVTQVRNAIDFLAQKGMVDFYAKQDFVRVKEKALGIYTSQQRKGDYDNLKIHSVIDSMPNATLNFAKRQMTIRGVEEFDVSDSLNCKITPDSATIVLLQNRDLKFDGKISAGNFEIVGKDFTLKYDSFFINLQVIDSIEFFVTEKNAMGQTVRRRIDNSLQGADSIHAASAGITEIRGSGGTLYISKPNNKSGRIKTFEYPRLDATSGGVIYFNRKEILNGVYDRSIFFMVPPFKLDSLNDADPSTINFEGTFSSNGMFPNFKDKLYTMPDKSLGFNHTTPKDGYQLFKGDGKFTGDISLDKRGIRSLGRIDYLAAHVNSNDFTFFPDSVIAKGKHAWIDQEQHGDVIFPQASFANYQMIWRPRKDEMKLKTTTTDFNFYDSTAQLKGSVTVSKKGVRGDGKLTTRGTELASKEMSFTSDQFGARHSEFKVLSDDPTKAALAGSDVRLRFNLKENVADVSPEIEGDAALEFPFAQFKTSIPRAHWDLNTQKITMSKDKDVPLENSYFYTTRKDLDSLRFSAEKAEYDIKKQELKVSGIPYIIVADAKITPDKNEVLILENAQIGTLKNTTIVIDTLNGYHRLTDGIIDIKSRNEFSGHATYQYVNFLKDTFAIQLTDFHLEEMVKVDSASRSLRKRSEKGLQTVATGTIDAAKNLVLGAGMYYKGDMKMYATRPALELDGLVKLDIKKIKDYKTWIRYKQTGEETGVFIDFNNAITEEGKKVEAGLHFDASDNSLYISFLSDKRNEEDEDFYTPSGSLFYDAEAKEYKIEDREKAAGTKLSGKVFSYNDNNQNIRIEGPINIFNGSSAFNVTATVIGQGNLETNDIRMNALVLIEAKIPATAFDLMARDIQTVIKNEGAGEGLGDLTELLYKVADIVGEKEARVYEQRSQKEYTSLSTIAATAKPLNFANVNLKWSQEFKAFYSEGSLGLANIGRNDINGEFEDNRLLVHSSNKEFNSLISKKTNSGKAKVGEMVFIPGSDDETLSFINRFRKDYYGIDVPYSLSSGSTAEKKKDTEVKKEDDGF